MKKRNNPKMSSFVKQKHNAHISFLVETLEFKAFQHPGRGTRLKLRPIWDAEVDVLQPKFRTPARGFSRAKSRRS